jgi:hypothetical protein
VKATLSAVAVVRSKRVGDTQLTLTAVIFHIGNWRKIMPLQSRMLLNAQTGVVALTFAVLAMPLPAMADPFVFSTGNPDGLIATTSRPSGPAVTETETADDFVLTQPTSISSATFTGVIPTGASITNVVTEVYRVFPADSNTTRMPNVPTRANSPSDVELVGRDASSGSLSFSSTLLSPNFVVKNAVLPGGIHPSPNQFTGGFGFAVTGNEVEITVNFTDPITLPSDHYFFVPQVSLSSGDTFLWLSAPRPIVPPDGTAFPPGFTDLQTWIRDEDLQPDWLRVGTDITGQGPFNASFSLNGVTVPGPTVGAGLPGLIAAAGALLALARRRRKIA